MGIDNLPENENYNVQQPDENDSEMNAYQAQRENSEEYPESGAAGDDGGFGDLLRELSNDDAAYAEQTDVKVKKKNKKALIVVIVVAFAALLAAAGVITALYLQANPVRTGALGNTGGNLGNSGIAVSDGANNVYYSVLTINPDNSNSGEFHTYRYDGESDVKISDNGGMYLNYANGYLYFVNAGDGMVYRMREDGTELKKLTAVTASYLLVKGDFLYYLNSTDYTLYSMELNGTNVKQLSDEKMLQLAATDENVYYVGASDYCLYKTDFNFAKPQKITESPSLYLNVTDENLLYCTESDNGEIKAVITDINGKNQKDIAENAVYMNLSGDDVYYTDSSTGAIKKYNIKTEETADLKVKGSALNIAGDKAYFANVDASGSIYRMNLDGSGKEQVGNEEDIKSINDYIESIASSSSSAS